MRALGHIAAAVAALLMPAAARAAADEDAICADRPGKASATCTVPQGHVQIETALTDWSLQKSGGERETVLTLAQALIKYGVGSRTDIELEVAPFVRDAMRDQEGRSIAKGIGDMRLRIKQRLTPDGAPVVVALYPYLTLPTAKHQLGSGQVEAGLAVPIGADIPHSPISLALTPELDWSGDEDRHGHHATMVQVASLGWAVSDAVTLSGELWGRWDWDPAGTTRQASADAAIAYVPRKDLQLDAGANVGLNRDTPDIELYIGVARRF